MIKDNEYYLITTHDWFLTPYGHQCKAVWGKVKVVEAKDRFGFVPLRPSTNWYAEIGEGENQVIVTGCQIHYAVKCAKKPVHDTQTYTDSDTRLIVPVNKIFFTE